MPPHLPAIRHAHAPCGNVLLRRVFAAPPEQIVYQHLHRTAKPSDNASTCFNISGLCTKGAIRQDGWKLVVGPEPQNGWYGW
jgi:hypothetical protein